MTDKELLELAAKAAGIELYQWVGKECCYEEEEIEGFELWFPFKDHRSRWNPLINDDDALRLAVKLRIRFEIHHSEKFVAAFHNDLFKKIEEEAINLNIYAATRRAIVRAAAEIGKAEGE